MKDKLIYLASPYTHEDKYIEMTRYKSVCIKIAELLKKGTVVFSPIAMFHPIAMLNPALGTTFTFWQEVNYIFLKRCDKFCVYRLQGWEESKGVIQETEWARQLNKPISHLNKYRLAV